MWYLIARQTPRAEGDVTELHVVGKVGDVDGTGSGEERQVVVVHGPVTRCCDVGVCDPHEVLLHASIQL